MYKILKQAKSLIGRLTALSLVFLLGFGGIIGEGNLSVQAAEETFNVDVIVWSEDGTYVDTSVNNVTFSNSTVTATPTSLTLKTDYSGRPLKVLQENGEYVDTSADGVTYTFPLNSIDEKIKVSFTASVALNRQISFTADDETLTKINAIYGQQEEEEADDSGNGTYTIPTVSMTEEGASYDNAKHAENAIVVISDDGVKAYITSAVSEDSSDAAYGGTLTFDVENSLYYTSDAGFNQYELSLTSLEDVVGITFGPNGRYTYYISFDSANMQKYTGNITDVVPNETEEEEVPEINATHTINVQLLDEAGAEHTQNSSLNPVAQVEMGSEINVYVSISGREFQFEKADGTFGNEIISTVDGVRTYKITVTDFSQPVAAQFATGGAGFVSGSYLTFDESSLSAINDGSEDNASEDDTSGNGTYTIPTISTTADGESYDNAKHAEKAIVVISDDGVKAYIASLVKNTEEYGGTLTFEVNNSLYHTSEAGYNQYELSLTSLDEVISITYGPSGRYTYYVSFDSSKLEKYTGNITDVVPNEAEEEEVPEINATHTINVQLLDGTGAEHTLNSTLNPVAQVEMGDETYAYVSISGREFQFENADGTFSNEIISTVDGVRTYKIAITDPWAPIASQFATGGTGFIGGSYLTFDESSLKAVGDDTEDPADDPADDPTEDPSTKTGVATFTIGAEFQNEDGSVNEARNEFLTQEATLKVSYQSLVVYVSASERELFFDPDDDGEYDNVIESYEDGIRTYKFELSDVSKLSERIKTTFNVSGTNPNYGSSMPIVYLAFSVDADSLAAIQDVFDNGITDDVDYTPDPAGSDDDGSDDDGSGDGGSGSGSSGTTTTGSGTSTTASSTKTGDTSSTGTLFILLLLSGVVIFCVNLRKKAI